MRKIRRSLGQTRYVEIAVPAKCGKSRHRWLDREVMRIRGHSCNVKTVCDSPEHVVVSAECQTAADASLFRREAGEVVAIAKTIHPRGRRGR